MSGFDAFADGLNHLASAGMDLSLPLLIGYALYLLHNYLTKTKP